MAVRSRYGFLADGKAAARIREIDWESTPVGGVERWSDSLRSLLGTMLRSSQPMLLLVGRELIQFYNDAYVDQGLSRHPQQMGARTADTWPEVIDALADQFATVLRDGTPVLNEDSLLPTVRNGRLVDTYFTYASTPFVDADGAIQGILITPVETTQRVLAAQRQAGLRAVSEAIERVVRAADLPDATSRALAASGQGATALCFYRSPRSVFAPSLWTSNGGQAGTSVADEDLQPWIGAAPALWARLQAGEDVASEHRVLVPLAGQESVDVVRLAAFELDPQHPYDAPYRQYLLEITRRVAQAFDRIAAESARASSASEVDALLTQAPIAAAVFTGPSLVFTMANPLYCQQVGKQRLIGKTFEQGFPELVGTEVQGLMHAAYDTGVPYVSPETPVMLDRHGGGQLEQCYFQFNLQPMRTIEGDVYALMAVIVDLTAQVLARNELDRWHKEQQADLKARAELLEETVRARTLSLQELNSAMARANQALKKAVDFNRNVTEMVPGRIAYWDADLRCQFANRRFCEWVGRSADEVIGRTGVELFSVETIARVQHHIDGARRGIPQRFETQAPTADGGVVYNQINYVPEPTTHQQPGFYLMAIDITPLKEAELALKAVNADLAHSRDEAEAASRTKSAFLANMSHEIRTPLNAILGMTHILSRRIEDASQLEQLGKVDGAARHLLGLISDVLDLSKIEAGKLVLERSDFVTSEVIGWAIEMVRGAAQAKGLALVDESTGLPRSLQGDPLRLSQILINLLSNAVKFTERGSVTLRAQVVQTAGDRHQLRFEVQDTGIGIAESSLPALFGSFEQADSSITRRHGGTGLGLALARQLARAMGGDAGVASTQGVGSRFWFTVWLEAGMGDAGGEALRYGPAGQTRPVRIADLEAQVRALHGGQRVLLAEDNPVNREVGVMLLESVGLTAVTAEDGAEAIARVKAEHFDLVLMDMQMPHVDGLEATRAIRADMNALPIVAMTANAFVNDRHACLAAGMDDHVSKPVDPMVLYAVLLRWLPPAQTGT